MIKKRSSSSNQFFMWNLTSTITTVLSDILLKYQFNILTSKEEICSLFHATPTPFQISIYTRIELTKVKPKHRKFVMKELKHIN